MAGGILYCEVKYVATRGRDRPSTPGSHVSIVRNMELSQLTECVDIIWMFGDIMSMDVYRSCPIVRTSAFRWNVKRRLWKWVGCKTLYRIYTVYFWWKDVFVIVIWYQDT